MELVNGVNLRQWLDRKGPMSVRDVLVRRRPGRRRARATPTQPGIIHRDIKPANILLAVDDPVDGSPRALVTDFGVAKALDETGHRHRRAHPDGPDPRHGQVPLPRAGRGAAGRCPHRRVRPRARALRGAVRAAPVERRLDDVDGPGPAAQRTAPPPPGPRRHPPRGGAGGAPGHGPGPRGSLRHAPPTSAPRCWRRPAGACRRDPAAGRRADAAPARRPVLRAQRTLLAGAHRGLVVAWPSALVLGALAFGSTAGRPRPRRPVSSAFGRGDELAGADALEHHGGRPRHARDRLVVDASTPAATASTTTELPNLVDRRPGDHVADIGVLRRTSPRSSPGSASSSQLPTAGDVAPAPRRRPRRPGGRRRSTWPTRPAAPPASRTGASRSPASRPTASPRPSTCRTPRRARRCWCGSTRSAPTGSGYRATISDVELRGLSPGAARTSVGRRAVSPPGDQLRAERLPDDELARRARPGRPGARWRCCCAATS